MAEAKLDPPAVPDQIAVEDGHKLFLVGHAIGVQIYACNATADGYAWGLVAPRADLYGDNGKLIATHFGGPTWQARDGSSVVGSVVDGVTVDPSAIPWLLLSDASTSPGPDGDRLAGTTFIQRVATDRRPRPGGRGLQPGDGGHPAGDPVHRRLLLLEGDGRLTSQHSRPHSAAHRVAGVTFAGGVRRRPWRLGRPLRDAAAGGRRTASLKEASPEAAEGAGRQLSAGMAQNVRTPGDPAAPRGLGRGREPRDREDVSSNRIRGKVRQMSLGARKAR